MFLSFLSPVVGSGCLLHRTWHITWWLFTWWRHWRHQKPQASFADRRVWNRIFWRSAWAVHPWKTHDTALDHRKGRYAPFQVPLLYVCNLKLVISKPIQATGLDAWASRVNVRHGLCHIYMIYVYIWVVHSFCLFCCLFIIVTTQFVALYEPCKPKPKPKPSTYDTRTTTPWQRSKFRYLDRSQSNKYAINMQIQTISVSK